jgi:O-antigen/teichoic acid export membrane protein
MRLWWGTALLAGSQAVGTALGMAFGILVSRTLGPEGKGVLAVLTIGLQIASVLGNLGFYRSNMFYVGQQPALRPRIAVNAAWIAPILGIATGIGLYLLTIHTSLLGEIPPAWLAAILVGAPFFFYNVYAQGILLGMRAILPCQAVDVGQRIALLVGTAVLTLGLHRGVHALVAWYVTTLVAESIAYALVVRGHVGPGPWWPDVSLFAAMVRYAGRTYGAALFTFLLSRLDFIWVHTRLGNGPAGIYSVAVQMVDALSYVPLAIAAQLIPHLAEDEARDATVTCQTARLFLILMPCLILLAAAAAWPGIRVLYGRPFLPAVPAMWAILPGALAVSLQTVLAGDLAGRGYPAFLVWVWLPGLAVASGCLPTAIARAGLVGAAATTSVAYSVVCGLTVWYFLRFHRLSWRSLVPGRAELALLRSRCSRR